MNVDVDGSGNIIIKDAVNSTITIINPESPSEVRKLIIDLNTRLSELSTEVLKILEEKQDFNSSLKEGANLYLTVVSAIDVAAQQVNNFKFGLVITNLTRENRYFNEPFFKTSPNFIIDGKEQKAFKMLSGSTNFPLKLEFGEPGSITFEIAEGAYSLYEELLRKDEKAHLQAFINTTIGELYQSNTLPLKTLIDQKNNLLNGSARNM